MEAKPKLEEKDVNKFDFTTFELNYIIKNANFNDFQLEVFKRLTDPHGRQTITKIALETNVCDRRGGRGRSNRMYRDRYGRSYRSDEYRECLEDLMEDTRESAREYEDVSEMATNSSDKQKLMKMAEREKEHHKYLKEMLENKM